MARHCSHSQTKKPTIGMIRRLELQQSTTNTHMLEPKTDMINKLKLQQGTTATHRLESQGQA